MSNWRHAFMPVTEPEEKRKKLVTFEKHEGQECKYVKRATMKGDKRVFYWIRTCDCGNQTDHSDMLKVHPDSLNKEEGVEMHLNQNCEWVLPKLSKFIKHFHFFSHSLNNNLKISIWAVFTSVII